MCESQEIFFSFYTCDHILLELLHTISILTLNMHESTYEILIKHNFKLLFYYYSTVCWQWWFLFCSRLLFLAQSIHKSLMRGRESKTKKTLHIDYSLSQLKYWERWISWTTAIFWYMVLWSRIKCVIIHFNKLTSS
jgi:hypothetical protein